MWPRDDLGSFFLFIRRDRDDSHKIKILNGHYFIPDLVARCSLLHVSKWRSLKDRKSRWKVVFFANYNHNLLYKHHQLKLFLQTLLKLIHKKVSSWIVDICSNIKVIFCCPTPTQLTCLSFQDIPVFISLILNQFALVLAYSHTQGGVFLGGGRRRWVKY